MARKRKQKLVGLSYGDSMTRKWLGSTPICDFCKKKPTSLFVDGHTEYGSWALMCMECFREHGTGLGEGHGQKYDAVTLEKVEG